MGDTEYKFDFLSTRAGCNKAIRHLETMQEVIADFEENMNVADLINQLINEKRMTGEQVMPMLHSLLVDKYNYAFSSYNLKNNVDSYEDLANLISKWNAFDIVICYFHPELGVVPINPKNKTSWEIVHRLQKTELVTIFVGEFAETEPGDNRYQEALSVIINILGGKMPKTVPAYFTKGIYKYREHSRTKAAVKEKTAHKKTRKSVTPGKRTKKEPAAPVPSVGQPRKNETPEESTTHRRMSKMYGITVTNGLFHNGNVEAWKKIIASYNHVYPNSQVIIYYDGEKINDINTLFQWGKVQRGTVIMIAVMGDDIKDLAKLRRYLEEGASSNFGRFLQGNPNMVLRLFV
jgi:hypothetical protein